MKDPEAMEKLIEGYMQYLEGDAPRPLLDDVDASLRKEAEQTFAVLDATWDSHVELPPFEEDPVAIRLGFVSAKTTVVLGVAIQKARKKANMKVADLRAALAARGWQISGRELASMHSRESEITADQLAALAEALGVDIDSLSTGDSPLVAWLKSSEVQELIARRASQLGRSPEHVCKETYAKMSSMAARSTSEEEQKWRSCLEVILEDLK